MPVVKLSDCIDRPNKPAGDLVKHCERVAAGCGRPDGGVEEKIAFLGGLCHDLAKCASDWQAYIRSDGAIKRGPPHAPLGAALFAFWAAALLPLWVPDRRDRPQYVQLALDWTRLIDNHHGRLDDLGDDAPWYGAGVPEEHQPARLLATCDGAGLDALVRRFFPECPARLADFPAWVESYAKTWLAFVRDRPVVAADLPGAAERHSLALRPAALGAKLIFADRADAADWEPQGFDPVHIAAALECHARKCRAEAEAAAAKGAAPAIIAKRAELQESAVAAYLVSPASTVYTLFLPTGYGKTLTGLRVALEALRIGRCTRIIYVAPYISILSQSADVIRKATGQPVFLHHHLSILGEDKDGTGVNDRQREDHQAFDLLDTWQAPILATTFNQLFRALFPRRAQECARIPALDGAFVFVDEPQAVEANVWCAFLRALAVTASERRCQVLFSTATLPPTSDGLGFEPTPLAATVEPTVSRYVIRSVAEKWRRDDVVREAHTRYERVGSVAVMLNTVRDAVEVFESVKHGGGEWYFLAAMMLPGHKARIIQQIREGLRAGRRIGIVSTQVLEAGVDLSFRSILRARSTFHSLAQTAGRGNRHGEGDPAEVVTFVYLRDDGRDSRDWVYKDATFRRMTDAILSEHPEIIESRLNAVLDDYYKRCWQENSRGASFGLLDEAAAGRWSELAALEPFGDSYPRIDVFVPVAKRYFTDSLRRKLADFECASVTELLEKSVTGQLPKVEDRHEQFIRRKQASALLRQCSVAVPVKIADRFGSERTNPWGEPFWLWLLDNPADYSEATGLAHLLTREDEGPELIIV
jgi:CRISPR-associated endonuclease/helicase Cas3